MPRGNAYKNAYKNCLWEICQDKFNKDDPRNFKLKLN